MKLNTKLILTSLLLFGIITTGLAQPGKGMRMNKNNGQRGMHMMCQNIPDLTDEQQEKIEALRVEHMKKRTAFRNQIHEKMAQIRTLTSGDNINMKKAEALADEVAALKAQMMKEAMSYRNNVRNLLTDEQKVYFDSRAPRHRMGKGRGHGQGFGNGPRHGRGPGQPDCPFGYGPQAN
jgi:Spy/CpxP family protein refolding chaperone